MDKMNGGKRGGTMSNDDRLLIVETLGALRELKGEMKEFKDHVIGRVQALEKKENDKTKERISIVSVVIAMAALAFSVIAKFFAGGL